MSSRDVVSVRHGVPHGRRCGTVWDGARNVASWTSWGLLAPRALGKEVKGSARKTRDTQHPGFSGCRSTAPSRAVGQGPAVTLGWQCGRVSLLKGAHSPGAGTVKSQVGGGGPGGRSYLAWCARGSLCSRPPCGGDMMTSPGLF